MHFNILTLFPEFFASPFECGLLGKAGERGILQTALVNPRDFTLDRHRSVDDRPYGGGPGMVMSLPPLLRALESIPQPGRVVLLTPRGAPLTQDRARALAQEDVLTLICGRYEGIDARLNALIDVESLSIGDFVLNGGESAALCLMEAVSRLQENYMGCAQSTEEESFSSGLLEYPHYTRPQAYRGVSIPEILTSGDHARIAKWRREQALVSTLKERPDLLENARLRPADFQTLRRQTRSRRGRNLYLALVHWPVVNKQGQVTAVSLTNVDIHDIARVCRTYGLGGYYLITPLQDQQDLARRLLRHWTTGRGGWSNPDREAALHRVQLMASLQEAVDHVQDTSGVRPQVVATSAKDEGALSFGSLGRILESEAVLLLLGTGSGLAPQVLQEADSILRPIRYLDDYNHLSVRSAAAVAIDRIMGDVW